MQPFLIPCQIDRCQKGSLKILNFVVKGGMKKLYHQNISQVSFASEDAPSF